jgi:hypothetical protein
MVAYVAAENAINAYSVLSIGAQLQAGVQVLPEPPPAIESLRGLNGFSEFGTAFTVTIRGSAFDSAATIAISGGGAEITEQLVVNSETIQIQLSYTEAASGSSQTISVGESRWAGCNMDI